MVVAEIQRFCTHDGPGLRTTVFFKGCPLRCVWCHNPETQKFTSQVMLYPMLCAACGACAAVCPSNAQILTQSERRRVVSLCQACGACVAVCPTEACKLVGRELTPAQVLAEVLTDAPFYGEAGGVTLSGGEPLCADGVVLLLRLLKQNGLHVIVETAGACEREVLRAALPYVDEFYFDIKHTDPYAHQALTGVAPRAIWDNLAYADAQGAKTRLRCLMVNGLTTDDAHVGRVADLYATLTHCTGVQLLRYHPMGGSKASALGLTDSGNPAWIPTNEQVARAARILERAGVPVLD